VGAEPKKEDKGIDLVNVAAVILPLLFITGGGLIGLLVTNEGFRLPYISILCAAIFGFSLSNLVRNFDLARRFEKFTSSEHDFIQRVGDKLDLVVRNSRVMANLAEESDLESLERFARWLAANRALKAEVGEISDFCEWQRSQMMNLLSNKTRECRDRELLIDDPVKELNSNTTLLLGIPLRQVVAVSFEDTPFWLSEEGQRFLLAHKQVLDRGVAITRIFIVQGTDETELQKVMGQQVEIGIEVYVVSLSAVEQLKPQDVVIYDNRLVRQGFNNVVTQNNMFKQARIIATPQVVSEELDKTRALIAMAKKWESSSGD
tara:strand:- start:1918 stop:2871 length:954 start_codon:yes stop_codon:yes gene_type:complete